MVKNVTECARGAVMLDGEISNCVHIFPRSCTGMYAITQFIQGIYINDMIEAVEAPKDGVTVGEDEVSGLMFCG